MKKILFLFLSLSLACLGPISAQQVKSADMPAKVSKAFQKKFPSAAKVKWEARNNGAFKADFRMQEKETSALFSEEGIWLETRTSVPGGSLPGEVRTTLANEFQGFQVRDAVKVITPDKGAFYEAHLEKGSFGMEVQVNAQGMILQHQMWNKEEKN